MTKNGVEQAAKANRNPWRDLLPYAKDRATLRQLSSIVLQSIIKHRKG